MTTAVATKRLVELEETIERGLATFVDVGNALAEIRNTKLYQKSHPTFEAYCRERWGWSHQRSNQLIAAAGVAAHLTTTVVKGPTNEAQARPLTKLTKPAQQVKAWERAQEIAKEKERPAPTARDVAKAVAEIQPPEPKQEVHTKDTRIALVREAIHALRKAHKQQDDHHRAKLYAAISLMQTIIEEMETLHE